MHTIKLGDIRVAVKAPKSFAVCQDLDDAVGDSRNQTRVLAAAIGLCWSDPEQKLKATYRRHNLDVRAFGGEVLEELHAKKVPLVDIINAGVECVRIVQGKDPAAPDDSPAQPDIITEAREREGFSEAPEAHAT